MNWVDGEGLAQRKGPSEVSKLTDSDRASGATASKGNAERGRRPRRVKDNAMNYRNEKGAAGKGLLLWLIGLPLPVILILWLLGVFH